jgi:hypothetical protein
VRYSEPPLDKLPEPRDPVAVEAVYIRKAKALLSDEMGKPTRFKSFPFSNREWELLLRINN